SRVRGSRHPMIPSRLLSTLPACCGRGMRGGRGQPRRASSMISTFPRLPMPRRGTASCMRCCPACQERRQSIRGGSPRGSPPPPPSPHLGNPPPPHHDPSALPATALGHRLYL